MSEGPAFRPVQEGTPSEETQPEQRELWAVLKIDVGDECPLTDIDATIENVDLQQMNGECKATVVTDEADMNVLQTSQSMGADCISWVFHEHGCVPHVMDAGDDSLTVTVYPDERETLPDLVESLRDLGYVVDVRRLVGVNQDLIEESTVLCDLSVLTEKQREAVELATERGYYDHSADADMGTMADELGISKSALSRRLKSAEAKLMLELMADSNDDCE
ncbi:MAG: putative DNA binding protein [Halobacteriales archaeon]|jgi:predicted DNA binding protein